MIPLYKPHMPELPELNEIIHSGQIANGKYTVEFEKRINNYLGISEGAVVVNSFHSAISVLLTLLDIGFGDEVVLSPMACLASTQPFLSHGIKICWADVDPNTGTLDPNSVKKKITNKTKAIIHNHFCGYPGYIDEINEIGKKAGIPVIDDGIECFGSEYKGGKIGNIGTFATIFSFNAVRIPSTIDGGCIILSDSSNLKKAKLVRDCGIDRSCFRDELGEINPACDIKLVGYSATMSNINAYIGMKQMECIDLILSKNRKNADKWTEKLRNNDKIRRIFRSEVNPNYWVYGIKVNDKVESIKMFRDMGYFASGVHINNNIYSIFGKQKTLPGVQEFYESFVALPCGWWIDENEL